MNQQTDSEWQLLRAKPQPVPELSPQQLAAAMPSAGVRVVLGGPGTGKTLTLVHAAAARLAAGTPIEKLVILAGSRQVAQRLRREIAQLAGGAQLAPKVTTSHGFALAMLSELGDPEQPFRLLRAPEQQLRIYELLQGMPAGFWPAELAQAVRTRGFAGQLREVITRARQLGLDPEQIAEQAAAAGDELFGCIAEFFEEYLSVCDFDASLDYAELIHRFRLLLTEDSAARSLLARFDAVLVDDVQDYDLAQLGLLTDLGRIGLPVLACGDPQQRIGGFRGANRSGLSTLRSLPGVGSFELTQGFRNRAAVNQALASIRQRLDQTGAVELPQPASGAAGVVTAKIYDDASAELAQIASQLRSAVLKDGLSWSDLAVVVRAGRSQLGPLARELTRYGVPVEVAGDELPLAGQPAVQVLLLALQLAATGQAPAPDQAHQLLTSPLAGLDSVQLRALGRSLRQRYPERGDSEQLIGRCLAEPQLLQPLTDPAAIAVKQLALGLQAASTQLAAEAPVRQVLWQLWDATTWPTELREAALAGSRQANHGLDAVIELFELADRREELVGQAGVRTFVQAVAELEIPADTGRELDLVGRGVSIMTAHRARSGQWARVWLARVQEGMWPQLTRRTGLLDPDRLTPEELAASSTTSLLADERRLFLVAASRAIEELHVSASLEQDDRPSRFLNELGVTPVRVTGRPHTRLSAADLIAELRQIAADPGSSLGLRRAAALRLARLAAVKDAEGYRAFKAADPGSWWGLLPTSGEQLAKADQVVISASELQLLLACPRHWFLSRQAKAQLPRAAGASVGDLVHILLAKAATAGLNAAELKAELSQVWDRLEFTANWQSAAERAELEAMIDRFCTWQLANPNQLLGVEEAFRVELQLQGRTVVLKGAVDRLELADGRLKVLDFKTGRTMPGKAELPGFEQLGVYQLAAQLGAFEKLAPGVRQVAAPELVYLRHGESLPKTLAQPSLADCPQLPATEPVIGPTWVHDKLALAVEILDSGNFEAKESQQCNFCQFKASCPALSSQLQEAAS